ncbi:hypothetical protein HanXRQr2_Chr10g0425091 [Helianthus annuus]|uniref:Uncharacterized protein n=1 Tax=Helianthus annuus TaxID=4232 RepID=A0A9K3HVC4_HELAN|nr:hypothetical protein HanXRQr2_Chr10g0425091 [Helianthus annuus]
MRFQLPNEDLQQRPLIESILQFEFIVRFFFPFFPSMSIHPICSIEHSFLFLLRPFLLRL